MSSETDRETSTPPTLGEWIWDCILGVSTSSWISCWSPEPELRSKFPKRHSDFRDSVPPSIHDVVEAYKPHVRERRWTFGLLEMWNPKAKYVKHAVHVPCWDSFRLNPFAWRGVWFGRTWNECLFTGFRQMRWSRAAYSGALGKEYVMPVWSVGRHGYLSDIRALFGLYCAMSCVLSCGIGQVFSLCGNLGCNFGAWYSCHAREKLRRRYELPSTFCLPPGIDDFLVHFFCFYCSSHQEMRELAVRGVDGPGAHVLDVCPESYRGAPGIDKALKDRATIRTAMIDRPPDIFKSRVPYDSTRKALMARLEQGFHSTAVNTYGTVKQTLFLERESCNALGWSLACSKAPQIQTMKRTQSDPITGATTKARLEVAEVYGPCFLRESEDALREDTSPPKAWSLAF